MDNAVLELSRRAGIDPYFLAFSLQTYAESEKLDETTLAVQLHTTPEGLARIRFCPNPRAETLAQDVARIATKFQLDHDVLLKIVRFGQVLAQLRAAEDAESPESATAFLAARDRPPS